MSGIDELVTQYRLGIKCRRQARQLSGRSLATKFERHPYSINRIAKGERVRGVDQAEADLIVECMAERERLLAMASELTLQSLALKAGVTERTILKGAGVIA